MNIYRVSQRTDTIYIYNICNWYPTIAARLNQAVYRSLQLVSCHCDNLWNPYNINDNKKRCTMYHALPMTFIVEVNQANLAWSFRQRLKWRDTHSEWHCWVSIKGWNGEHRKLKTGASLMNYQAWKGKIVQQNKNILGFCGVYYSKGLEYKSFKNINYIISTITCFR